MRLAEIPSNRVLLLEAGTDREHWSIRMPAASRNNYTGGPRNWCFETEPEPFLNHRRLFQPRGKVIGGSSSLNGMVYVRGNRLDYDGWAASGAAGWAYRDVLPHFRALETYRGGGDEYHGDRGPVTVERLRGSHPLEQAYLEAAVQAGYRMADDYNGAEQEGVTAFDANIDNGQRSATAACIRSIRDRKNFTLRAHAHVTRLIIENARAVGVEYLRHGDLGRVYADAEVIVCAGAFQSPQILMLSGIGPAGELRDHGIEPKLHLPGVGENLQDHLEVHVKHRTARGLSKNGLLRRDRVLRAGMEWFLFKSGEAATPHSRVGGFLCTDESVGYPNLQFHYWPFFLEGWSPPPRKDGYCFDVGPVRSDSRGRIRLRSADPLDAPRILLNGLALERDLAEFRQCIRIAREIASQRAFEFCRGPEVSPGPEVTSDRELDEYVRGNANSAYHPCGTCRMGVDDMSVVDPELRVHGIGGLRVADASVMPRITNGNINAPCLMIGERAAALILGGASDPADMGRAQGRDRISGQDSVSRV